MIITLLQIVNIKFQDANFANFAQKTIRLAKKQEPTKEEMAEFRIVLFQFYNTLKTSEYLINDISKAKDHSTLR